MPVFQALAELHLDAVLDLPGLDLDDVFGCLVRLSEQLPPEMNHWGAEVSSSLLMRGMYYQPDRSGRPEAAELELKYYDSRQRMIAVQRGLPEHSHRGGRCE